jgi:predicted ribosome quality control (RQC) complex YloA/Tae2 family protein
MAFDYITIKNIVEEFRSEILGTYVKESLQTEKHSLLLRFDEGHHLTICCSPHLPAIFLSSSPVLSPKHRPWQSNNLTGSVVQNIEQMGTDRVIRFQLEKQNRVGTARRVFLIVELIGRNSNIILVDKDTGLIIDALRRVTHQMSRFRQILPKVAYLPPPPQTRLNPQTGSLTEFKEMICSHPDQTVVHVLVGTIVGMSMLTAREIAFRSGVDWEEKPISLSKEKLVELWENICSLYGQSWGGKTFIIFDEKKSPVDFCIFNPSWVLAEQKLQVSSQSKAVEYFCSRRFESQKKEELGRFIATSLNKALLFCRTKLQRLREELTEAQEAESLKIKGELLTGNLSQIKKGQAEVKLSNFYDSQGQEVSIVLDPELSPIENARQYFRRYRKLSKAKTIIKQRLTQEQNRAEELEVYRKQAESLTDYADLLAVRDELAQKGYLKIEILGKKRDKEGKKENIAPRRYLTSTGWTVLVGRTDRENDILTLRLAAPDDLWFHAQGSPGSHVVLRRKDRKSEPDKTTLVESAALAAYWSKARGAETVPVSCTLAKYVRKPRGAKPGTVIISREKTLFVKPRLLPIYRTY